MDTTANNWWDLHAGTFDDEADHGLRDPEVRRAWTTLLSPLLPAAPARVVDVGCGTGTLTVLLSEAGYVVHGLDMSWRMLDYAAAKSDRVGSKASFVQADASRPPFAASSFDVVLTRHVLWALPDPGDAIQRWSDLLKPEGLLILVEGQWSTGAGMPASVCRSHVLLHRHEATIHQLDDPALWGKAISDERYLILSRR